MTQTNHSPCYIPVDVITNCCIAGRRTGKEPRCETEVKCGNEVAWSYDMSRIEEAERALPFAVGYKPDTIQLTVRSATTPFRVNSEPSNI